MGPSSVDRLARLFRFIGPARAIDLFGANEEQQLEGFRPTHTDVLFIEMQPEDHGYEPLIGYVVLEQAQIAVDMVGHRLIHAGKADLK